MNTLNTTSISDTQASTRKRLPSHVRIQQILDAAQIEFSEHGFTAARTDDIASRCGLSKGGLYSHFKSKEELFEALVCRSLTPPDLSDMPDLSETVTVRHLAEWLVGRFYAFLENPSAIATFRLLIAESERASSSLATWRRQVLEPHLHALGETLKMKTGASSAIKTIIANEPWLVISPIVHIMVSQVIFGDAQDKPLKDYRQAHIAFLCELLK